MYKRDVSVRSSNSISLAVLKTTVTKNIIVRTKMIKMGEFRTMSNMIIKGNNSKGICSRNTT